MPSDAVTFDLGGVVLSWDPRAAYERVLPAEEVATPNLPDRRTGSCLGRLGSGSSSPLAFVPGRQWSSR
jgi:hypothetical protein